MMEALADRPVIPPDFKMGKFFAKHQFSVKHLLCCSDAESVTMEELLSKADDECKRMWNQLKLSYTDSQGHPLLRKEIATLYPTLLESDVITAAPQEAIYIAMKAFMSIFYEERKGSTTQKPHVVATYPGYQGLHGNLETDGAEVTYWKAQYDQETGWSFSLDHLLQALKPETRLLVVNFPHNPTGWTPNTQQWNEIVDICRKRDIILFSDEMYRYSNIDRKREEIPAACTMYDNAVTLNGLSKIFSLPGLRVGWLGTRNKEFMQRFCSIKDWLSMCMSAPSEILAIIGLRNKQWLINRTMDIIHTNLKLLNEFFAKYPQYFEWHQPHASSISFVKVKPRLLELEKCSLDEWCDKLVLEYGVLILPAKYYDYKDNFFRVGFGRKNLKDGLNVLDKYLSKLV